MRAHAGGQRRIGSIPGRHQRRADAGAQARLQVAQPVADHPAGAGIERELVNALEDEARRGLAVDGGRVGMLGGHAAGVEDPRALAQQTKEPAVDGVDLLPCEVTAADAALVREKEEPVGAVRPAQRLPRPGQ